MQGIVELTLQTIKLNKRRNRKEDLKTDMGLQLNQDLLQISISIFLILFRMAGEGGGVKAPYHFFPCNFYNRKN